MTKKDYVIIAGRLRDREALSGAMTNGELRYYPYEVVEMMKTRICHDLKADNPKFDEKKFLSFILKN